VQLPGPLPQARRRAHGGRGGDGCSGHDRRGEGRLVAGAGPDWVPIAITAVSTLSASAIGAWAVYRGSARASEQAVAIAREQRRYERVHEMRAEVLPTIYADLHTLHDAIVSLSTVSLTVPNDTYEELLDRIEEIEKRLNPQIVLANEKVDEIYEYYKLHILWIPEDIKTFLLTARESLADQLDKSGLVYENFDSVLAEASSRRKNASLGSEESAAIEAEVLRAAAEADAQIGEIRDWLRTTGQEHLKAVRVAAQGVLITET
jgi:hypothetical protein